MITDEDSLDVWLAANRYEAGVALAWRAAMRAFVRWQTTIRGDASKAAIATALPMLRCLLSTGITIETGSLDVAEATNSAAEALPLLRSSPLISAGGNFLMDAIENTAKAALVPSEIVDASGPMPDALLHPHKFLVSNACGHSVRVLARGGVGVKSSSDQAEISNILASVWGAVDADAAHPGGQYTFSSPLWQNGAPGWLGDLWSETQRIWSSAPTTWGFWRRWYQGYLDGQPFPMAMQRDIALIPDAVWQQGPDHIARLIAGIEERHRTSGQSDPLAAEIVALPSATASTLERVRNAISLNRDSLPLTFDAIEGFIRLEVARLQSLNYKTDDEAEECRRQIGVLGILHDTIRRMRAAVPQSGTVTTAQAETVERLTRVFGRHLKEWPRANAGDLVDSVYRGALVGACTVLLPLLDVAPTYALAAGIVFFGGKKIGEALNVAKEVLTPKA